MFKLHIHHLRFVHVSVCFYFHNIYINEVFKAGIALLVNLNNVVPEVDLFVGAGTCRDAWTQAPSGSGKSRHRSARLGHKDGVTPGDLPPAREPCCGAIQEKGGWCCRRPLGRGTLDGFGRRWQSPPGWAHLGGSWPTGASLKRQRFARLSGAPSGHLLRSWPPLLRGHLEATATSVSPLISFGCTVTRLSPSGMSRRDDRGLLTQHPP